MWVKLGSWINVPWCKMTRQFQDKSNKDAFIWIIVVATVGPLLDKLMPYKTYRIYLRNILKTMELKQRGKCLGIQGVVRFIMWTEHALLWPRLDTFIGISWIACFMYGNCAVHDLLHRYSLHCKLYQIYRNIIVSKNFKYVSDVQKNNFQPNRQFILSGWFIYSKRAGSTLVYTLLYNSF